VSFEDMKHPRKLSMNRSGEFSLSRDKGKAKAGRFLVLSSLADSDLPHLKCAYITTKKIGKANVRNRIRRQFRAILQKHGDRLKDKRYLVTIARWRAAEASFAELEKDWLKQARRLGIIAE